jgi:putative NADH-flavin reductase
MQLLVIGGSGRVGKLVVKEALTRGHSVTALVRNKQSLDQTNRLTIVEGTPMLLRDVEKAFAATATPPEVIIFALASVRETGSPFAKQVSPPRLMADSNANIVAISKQYGNSKIVVCSSVGVGNSWDQMPFLTKALMSHSNMKFSYDDHNLVDSELRKSGINFTLVRPARLVFNEEVKHIRELGEDGRGLGLLAAITSGSVAKFLVDAAEGSRWDGKATVITN